MKSLVIIFLLSIVSANAQQSPYLDYFSAFVNREEISLNWTISGGNTCNGIKILRSTDTISFNEIGFISGICGNSSTPVSYNYLDADPVKNRINYYRLELGTLGLTDFIQIEYITYNDDGYQVRPNPVSDEAIIYFNNDIQKEYTFKLFDVTGKLIYSEENIVTDTYHFKRDELPGSIYFFTLENSNESGIRGKLIILH